jgi:hypothetical protein
MSIDFPLPCFLGVIFQNVLAIVNPSMLYLSFHRMFQFQAMRSKTVVLIPSTSVFKTKFTGFKSFCNRVPRYSRK